MADSPPRRLRVLWATDGSATAHAAIPLLRQIVLPAAEQVTVLSVAPHSFLSGARPEPAFLAKITPAARRRALIETEELAEHEAVLLDPAVPVETVVRWGNPIEVILATARSTHADVIVLGAKGHSNLKLILLGSVCQGVVQHATQSVLIARPGIENVGSLLVGYESTPAARKAVQFVEALALPPEVEFRLAEVIEPVALPPGTPVAYRAEALAEAHRANERRRRAAERALAAQGERLRQRGRRVDAEVLVGEVGLELDETARKQHSNLIVVGSLRPSMARHYLVGSTAEKLVRHSHTSVLVVK